MSESSSVASAASVVAAAAAVVATAAAVLEKEMDRVEWTSTYVPSAFWLAKFYVMHRLLRREMAVSIFGSGVVVSKFLYFAEKYLPEMTVKLSCAEIDLHLEKNVYHVNQDPFYLADVCIYEVGRGDYEEPLWERVIEDCLEEGGMLILRAANEANMSAFLRNVGVLGVGVVRTDKSATPDGVWLACTVDRLPKVP